MRRELTLACLLVAAPLSVGAQQVIFDPARSSQPANRLAADLLRWTDYYADDVFGLHTWRIVVTFEPLEGNVSARTSLNLTYRIAQTQMDLTKLALESEAWRTVLHEVLHIRLGEMSALMLTLASGTPGAEAAVLSALEAAVTDLSMAAVWKRP